MTDRLSELVVELNQWLEQAATGYEVIGKLNALAGHEWMKLARQYPPPRRFEIARTLIDRAHALLSREPKHAEPVARAAVHFAKVLIHPRESGQGARIVPASDLEAAAWREHAHALLTLGQYEAALLSANEAWFIVSLNLPEPGDGSLLGLLFHQVGVGDTSHEQLEAASVLALIMGQILHGLGDSDEGLVMISQASHIFNVWLDQKKKYVEGRTIYAKILADLKRYSEAVAAMEQTATLAKELGDRETLAHIVNNIGVCYYFLGNLAKAEDCVRTALGLFESLGLTGDALRPRNVLATILIDAKRYNTAVSELYLSRAAFLDAGLPNEAARAMLKIVRAMILAGRQRDINWSEMERTFAEAGVRSEVMKALVHLRDIAHERPLQVGDVAEAEDILSLFEMRVTRQEEAG